MDENNLNKEEFSCWWNQLFDNQIRIILIEWEWKDENPIGRADGMVWYISEGKVLITNYCDLDDDEQLSAPLNDFFDVERLHFGDIEGIKETKMWSMTQILENSVIMVISPEIEVIGYIYNERNFAIVILIYQTL